MLPGVKFKTVVYSDNYIYFSMTELKMNVVTINIYRYTPKQFQYNRN